MRLAADEQGIPALGYVIRYHALQAALDVALERSGVTVRHGVEVAGVRGASEYAAIDLRDGASAPTEAAIEARLAAVADGTGGTMTAIPRQRHDYKQVALTAKLWREAPHEGIASSVTPEGPMALLPENDRYGLVWTATPDRAQELLALDDSRFLDGSRAISGRGRAGSPVARSPHISARARIRPRARARAALLGNAAQTLHPVAGRDSMSGCATRGAGADRARFAARWIGDEAMLRRFIARPAHGSDGRHRVHARTRSSLRNDLPGSLAARVGAYFARFRCRQRSAHSHAQCCSVFGSRGARIAARVPKSVPLCATLREIKSRARIAHRAPRSGYNSHPAAISLSVFR
jgi:hypothetical protein